MGPIASATISQILTSGKIASLLRGQQECKGVGWVTNALRFYSLKVKPLKLWFLPPCPLVSLVRT